MKKCNYAKKIGLKINNKNLVKIYIYNYQFCN